MSLNIKLYPNIIALMRFSPVFLAEMLRIKFLGRVFMRKLNFSVPNREQTGHTSRPSIYRSTYTAWLSARKKFKGGAKTISYCFYCSFYCFLRILGGQKSFWGRPLPPSVAESQTPSPEQQIIFPHKKDVIRNGFYLKRCLLLAKFNFPLEQQTKFISMVTKKPSRCRTSVKLINFHLVRHGQSMTYKLRLRPGFH